MNHVFSKPFKIFLVVYGGFLIFHLSHVEERSLLLWAVLFSSTVFAILVHKNHGYVPSSLLIAHMAIEWYSHAVHSNHYTNSEYFFHGVHACLDLMFLYTEARAHYKKYGYLLIVGVLVFLGLLFWYFYVPVSTPSLTVSPLVAQALEIQKQMSGQHKHVHGGGVMYHLVIGGMLGCVISHLFFISKWNHTHTH